MATEHDEVSFGVEVLDDHDGGSVWISEEEFLDGEDARKLARKLSLTRDNRIARLVEVTRKPVLAFRDGKPCEE